MSSASRTRRTATQWGVYDVDVVDGRIVSVRGIDLDPDPSPIGDTLVDGVQTLRVERPAVRRGWLEGGADRGRDRRGAEPFVEVDWDVALRLAADEIERVRTERGNQAIYGGSYGWASAGRFHHAQSQLHRFMNVIGGCTRSAGSYSTAAAQTILPHVVEQWSRMELEQTTWSEIAEGGELVVSFGGLPVRNSQVAYGGITRHEVRDGIRRAHDRGVRFVTIGPQAADTPDFTEHRWIPIRPGTDVALMLGVAFVLDTEALVDREFLDRCTVGYERFEPYLRGERDGVPKTPDWASEVTGVPTDVIVGLAHDMAAHRTLLNASWALQRAHHGEQPYWMLVVLACMLGDVGTTGGGFGFGHCNEGHIGSDGRRFGWAAFPQGASPISSIIPVARIADMLLEPGTPFDFDGRRLTYPEIDLVYWAGGNPFHHHQDLNRLVEAWKRPSTVIVHEPWWTPIARHADIVFPATTAQERVDVCMSSHDPYAHVMEQIVEPPTDARSDHAIFAALADLLGVGDEFTEGRDERAWMAHMWELSAERARAEGFGLPSFDEFWAAGRYELPPSSETRAAWLADFRNDPAGNPLATPSGRIEIFSESIAGFGYDDCPGHPVWLEPYERLGGAGADRFPFHLVSHQPATRLHSQLDHSTASRRYKIGDREVVRIHPDAAGARNIVDGGTVRLFNDRGACLAAARLDPDLKPDVLALPTGAWYAPLEPGVSGTLELGGNPNVLTRDVGTSSLAQGPTAHTCLVDVEPYHSDAPPPSVYEPPPLIGNA